MEELGKSFEVEICGVKYTFSNQIGREKDLLNSFNKLSKNTFGLEFESVGGDYEPHVLALAGRVCANVSVNQIPFYYRGKRKFYIQLGTVMTDPEFRGRGLSRWLIEYVIAKWKDNCDAIYLFANNSVLDFYPKFGFVKTPEFEFQRPGIKSGSRKAQKLPMNDERNVQLVLSKYEQGNPFSALYMTENQGLLSFYCLGLMKDNIYYSPQYDVIIVAENEKDKIKCFDILGKTDAALGEVLSVIASEGGSEIVLGFTPSNIDGFTCQAHYEEDTTLFVHADRDSPFTSDQLMFPIISHA